MSTNDILKVETRREGTSTTEMRKAGYVPGVIFGKDFDGVNFAVPKIELTKFLHHSGKVFEVEVGGKKHLVALSDVQRGHFGTDFVHCSFHKVSATQEVVISLPIHFVGEAVGTKEGGLVNLKFHEVEVKGLPGDMPEFLEFDLTELALDENWTFEHFTLPRGVEWAQDVTETVASCHVPKVKVEEPTVEETAAEMAPEVEGDITPVDETEKEAA